MTERALTPHRGGAALQGVRSIVARVQRVPAGLLRLEYRLSGELASLAIPRRVPAERADRLWEHTCFEAFVACGAGAGYYELNFSPSTEWAAYEFDGYRHGMRPLALDEPPRIAVAATATDLTVTASVAVPGLAAAPWPWRVGLTAVVEDRCGGRGYYALRHPRDTPDFHDAAGFAISLDGSLR